MDRRNHKEKFERVIGVAGVTRLLRVRDRTVYQWIQRTRRKELPTPFPAPIPELPGRTWYIEDIVRFAVLSVPESRWPKDRGDPAVFLAQMNIIVPPSFLSPTGSEDPLAANGPATTPDQVLFNSTNENVPVVVFSAPEQ